MPDKIYIFCHGGLVQGVSATIPNQEVIVLDADIFDEFDPDEEELKFYEDAHAQFQTEQAEGKTVDLY